MDFCSRSTEPREARAGPEGRRHRRAQAAAAGGAMVTKDATLYWMLLVIGSVPIVGAVARHAAWGVQPTLGSILVSCALCGLVGLGLQRRRAERDQKSH